MKNLKPKSFAFKVAKENSQKKQAKARDGVAVAGCTLTTFPWGREPTANFITGGDGDLYC